MKLILGVCGSISAYRAVDIMRLFMQNKHDVSVILTNSAQKFIPALTFETFNPGKVFKEMFAPHQDPLLHINLCKDTDILLIAPASANMIGKIANGIGDDLLSTTFLAFYNRVVIAPAMNTRMLENPIVTENISRLKSRGVAVIEPETGLLACHIEGKGKLPSPEKIYQYCLNLEKPNA